MSLKIFAVDDEYLALEGLCQAIKETDASAEVWRFQDMDSCLESAAENKPDVAFLDIAIHGANGVSLAQKLKEIYPQINIIFVTGYREYMEDAFKLHSSGYIMKPVTAEKVRNELENLRHTVSTSPDVFIQTFGEFEVFVNRKPIEFSYVKTKELLAVLVDAKGAFCSNAQIEAILWEDDACHKSYFRNLISDLKCSLKNNNCIDIVKFKRGQLGLDSSKFLCDYLYFLEGDERAVKAFNGEYMSQYSWAEPTLGALSEYFEKKYRNNNIL